MKSLYDEKSKNTLIYCVKTYNYKALHGLRSNVISTAGGYA